MLTLTLRVTQKYAFRQPKIKTQFICHESFSLKFSYAKKKYGAMLKKERHMKLSKEKNGTHEGSEVLKRKK